MDNYNDRSETYEQNRSELSNCMREQAALLALRSNVKAAASAGGGTNETPKEHLQHLTCPRYVCIATEWWKGEAKISREKRVCCNQSHIMQSRITQNSLSSVFSYIPQKRE